MVIWFRSWKWGTERHTHTQTYSTQRNLSSLFSFNCGEERLTFNTNMFIILIIDMFKSLKSLPYRLVSVPGGVRDISFFCHVQTSSGIHLEFYDIDVYCVWFLKGKVDRVRMWLITLHIIVRLRMCGVLPPHIFLHFHRWFLVTRPTLCYYYPY